MAPIELPVGIVTAMIGGPFFMWLLVRRSMKVSFDPRPRYRALTLAFTSAPWRLFA